MRGRKPYEEMSSQHQYAYRLRLAHKCITCRKTTGGEFAECYICKNKRNKKNRAQFRLQKKASLCVQGKCQSKPLKWNMCEKHLLKQFEARAFYEEDNKVRALIRYRKLKAEGICTSCGVNFTEGKAACSECLWKRKEARERKKRTK